jgi:hypothetical protein
MAEFEKADRNHELIPVTASLLLVLLCLLWGGNLVSIKISNQGVPPILAAALSQVRLGRGTALGVRANQEQGGVFAPRRPAPWRNNRPSLRVRVHLPLVWIGLYLGVPRHYLHLYAPVLGCY